MLLTRNVTHTSETLRRIVHYRRTERRDAAMQQNYNSDVLAE